MRKSSENRLSAGGIGPATSGRRCRRISVRWSLRLGTNGSTRLAHNPKSVARECPHEHAGRDRTAPGRPGPPSKAAVNHERHRGHHGTVACGGQPAAIEFGFGVVRLAHVGHGSTFSRAAENGHVMRKEHVRQTDADGVAAKFCSARIRSSVVCTRRIASATTAESKSSETTRLC